ncbi:Rgg/GadR/MutR family transcriptional regulator [Vagococcus lutrae]|uniref:Rgg/GadR/MutR family transcriptional regulator n=1 Tax=Vagococcus lutrae TaxID=81947 RepID=UPI0028904DB8|nr:helix-turn-helix domain-containing protein [Vagococcus lutrae]MDT2807757.1 helix-turn-helix domain-containing protein [Vagococcus lutrae]
MRKNSGEIFKELRISKQYTLADVAKDIASVSLLSKFERGEVDISFNKLSLLLKKINVSLYEFDLIANNYHSFHIEYLISKLKINYHTKNIGVLEMMMLEEKKMFEENKLQFHNLNSIMISSVLNELEYKKKVPNKDIEILMDYLFSSEQWMYYEIVLYSNSLNSIPIDSILLLSKELLNKSKLLSNNLRYRKLIIETLINTCIVLLEKNKMSDYLFFYNSIVNLNLLEEEMYEKTILLYLNGWHEYKMSNTQLGLIKMKDAIFIFNKLGCDNLEFNFNKHFINILKSK